MKVGLVADTFSVEQGTGIARYSQELLTGLIGAGLNVKAISPEPPSIPLGSVINHAVKMPYAVWSKANAFDVIHATSPITALAFPVISKPRVVTYHDLVSLVLTNTSSALHTRVSAPLFLRVGKYANRIIANSSQTKEEIVVHLGIPADRITVVSWGIGGQFRPQKREVGDRYDIGYVGALNRRKSLPYLFRAIHVLRTKHPEIPAKLVICGRRDLEYAGLVGLAAELGLSQVIEFKGSMPDEELVGAYNSFDILVHPSEWEGFGLPILEAQRCGVPVIIREDAHIPQEVSQCCLKATSEQDMADKMHELLTDERLREEITERGLEYSQQFTWERTVQQTVEVYEEAAS
jgi:glycosyltransferase involved in cell wall biosynthesis